MPTKIKKHPKMKVPEICNELQRLQRNRETNMKSRIMLHNRLLSTVARWLGYEPSADEATRKESFKTAQQHIDDVLEGRIESEQKEVILNAMTGINGFKSFEEFIESQMIKLVKQLPIAAWANRPSQKGLGLLSLAKIIGETGDLSNYANPGKVWKRLGLAPFQSKGHSHAPSTWRKNMGHHKLTSAEFVELGYSPRRRAMMHVIGECLLKANTGIYRKRYDTIKNTAMKNRPDWTTCPDCEDGRELKSKRKCSRCKGTGKLKIHCHRHGMLVMTKLLIKNLWMEWNPDLVVDQPW